MTATLARLPFPLGAMAAVAALAYALATETWLAAAALSAGSLAAALVLFSPAAALLTWLALSPTLGGLANTVLGGGLPALTPDRGLFVLLAAAVVVRGLRHPGSFVRPQVAEAGMLAFLLIATVSTFVRGGTFFNHEGGLRRDFIFLIQGYGLPFAAYFLARSLLREERHARWLLGVLVTLGAVLAGIGLVQYLTGMTLFMPKRFEHIHDDRITGTLGNAVDFGMVIAAGLLAALLQLRHAPRARTRVVLLAAAGLIVVSIVLTKTRSVWLGALVGLGTAAAYDRRLRVPLCAAALLALVIGLGLAAWRSDRGSDGGEESIAARLLSREPIYNRVALAATAVNMILERPLLGWGFGRYTFIEEKRRHLTSFAGVRAHWAWGPGVPHNEVFHILILVGLVGFLSYLAAVGGAWRAAVAVYRHHPAPASAAHAVVLTALAALAMYMVNGLFCDLMFDFNASNQVFVLLGAAVGLVEPQERIA
jgi:O-antigen ligase